MGEVPLYISLRSKTAEGRRQAEGNRLNRLRIGFDFPFKNKNARTNLSGPDCRFMLHGYLTYKETHLLRTLPTMLHLL